MVKIHTYTVASGNSRAPDTVELCEGCGAQLEVEMNGQASKSARSLQEDCTCEWCGKANYDQVAGSTDS